MSSTGNHLEAEVLRFLNEENVPSGSRLIVALSGGPDSTALLAALAEIRKKFPITLQAAYVNHQLRDPSELIQDDLFVRSLTENLDVHLYERHAGKNELHRSAATEKRSLEEVARRYRYDFFNEIYGSDENSFLLTGHNLDDQLETIIIRVFQGAGIKGLKGIPHRNGNIIRPLIHMGKKDILGYLKEKKLSCRIDPTNFQDDFLRNRVRNQLIPLIREIFPGLETTMIRQEEMFITLDGLFDKSTDAVKAFLSDKRCSVNLEEFNDLNEFVRLRLLYRMFDRVFPGSDRDFRVPSAFFNPLIKGKIESDRTYASAHGVVFLSNSENLNAIPYNSEDRGFYFTAKENTVAVPDKYILKIHNADFFTQPLVFRSSRKSDVIVTDSGKIHLRDLMKESKGQLPVLEDKDGLLAVFSGKTGGKDFFRKKKMNAWENLNILYLEEEKDGF